MVGRQAVSVLSLRQRLAVRLEKTVFKLYATVGGLLFTRVLYGIPCPKSGTLPRFLSKNRGIKVILLRQKIKIN